MEKKNRKERGLESYTKLSGKEGNPFENLGSIGDKLLKYSFGEIYSRDGLSLRERQISNISTLTVLGQLEQLKVHIRFGLNVGLTKEEIEEVILNTTPIGGFPTAVAAKNVLDELTD